MFRRQTPTMMNIEFARILQADREREIAAALRARRLLEAGRVDTPTPSAPAPSAAAPSASRQRPASTGVATR